MVLTSSGVIIGVIARRFDVTPRQLMSNRRDGRITVPRSIAMYLARVVAKESYPTIAAAFGGRHHTTVIAAVRRVERNLELLKIAERYMAPEAFKESENLAITADNAINKAMELLATAMNELEIAKNAMAQPPVK